MVYCFLWFIFFFYLIFLQYLKFYFLGSGGFFNLFKNNFSHQGVQSSIFFKVSLWLLFLFWLGGMFFPLFSPWSCIGYLFFLTNFSWLGARTFTLFFGGFMIFFEEEHSWGWLSSLVMFFSHWLSYFMSAVALTLRISIIFLMGHFLMFSFIGLNFFSSVALLFFVLPLELFFAFLQSYIFLTLVCMFLLNMI